MAYSDGPKIVTNGLVLVLDAADKNSYPGTGTIWRDLSSNNNVFEIPSDYSYTNNAFISTNSVYNNYIADSGQFDIVNIPLYSTFTLNIVFSFNTDIGSLDQFLIGPANIGNESVLLSVAIFYPNILKITGEDINGNPNWTPVSEIEPDTNYMLTVVSNESSNQILYYLNGVYIGSISTYTNIQVIGLGGSTYDGGTSTFNSLYQGKIYLFNLYNRVLSTSEIQQNYNAIKRRLEL